MTSIFFIVSEVFCAVAGSPVIKHLKESKKEGQQKILVCEVEGSPKPAVSWSINGTLVCTLTRSKFPLFDQDYMKLLLHNCCNFSGSYPSILQKCTYIYS